jgi:hypothetical protein
MLKFRSSNYAGTPTIEARRLAMGEGQHPAETAPGIAFDILTKTVKLVAASLMVTET